MHLKVILQGDLCSFTSPIYASGHEFQELCDLIGQRELQIADELSSIGARRWPSLEVIFCYMWCRAPDIGPERLRYLRSEKLLEASILIEGDEFRRRTNEDRCTFLFHRALTQAAAGFRKYRRVGGDEIEAIRDHHFAEVG